MLAMTLIADLHRYYVSFFGFRRLYPQLRADSGSLPFART